MSLTERVPTDPAYIESLAELTVGTKVTFIDPAATTDVRRGQRGRVVRVVEDPVGFVPYCLVVVLPWGREVAVEPSEVERYNDCAGEV